MKGLLLMAGQIREENKGRFHLAGQKSELAMTA